MVYLPKTVNVLDSVTQEVSFRFVFQEVHVHLLTWILCCDLKALKMKSAIYYKANDNECSEPIFIELFPKGIWGIFGICLLKFFQELFYFTFQGHFPGVLSGFSVYVKMRKQ